MAKFTAPKNLPATGCLEQDFYDEMENLVPTADLVDADTMQVASDKLYVGLLVPRWKKMTAVEFDDIAVAALTTDVALFTLPAGGVIEAVKIKASTAFSGGAVSSLLASVGITGNLTKYSVPFDLMAAVSDTNFGLWNEFAGETHDAAGTSIRFSVEAIGANLDQLTAGVVDIWVKYAVVV